MLHDLPLSMLKTPVLRTGVKKRGSNEKGFFWFYLIADMTTNRQFTGCVSYICDRATRGVRRKSGEIADISLVIMAEDARYGVCQDRLDEALLHMSLQTYHNWEGAKLVGRDRKASTKRDQAHLTKLKYLQTHCNLPA